MLCLYFIFPTVGLRLLVWMRGAGLQSRILAEEGGAVAGDGGAVAVVKLIAVACGVLAQIQPFELLKLGVHALPLSFFLLPFFVFDAKADFLAVERF